MKIGVFDSGVGGLSVANAVKKALPDAEVILKEDKANVPYGTRQPEEILGLVEPIFQAMVDEGCEVIVIACNTVSTNLMPTLRAKFQLPLIAVEPMLKSAARLSKTGVVTVCATPTTLASPRYKYLKRRYAGDIKVLEPDCHDWAYMIEQKQVDREKIRQRIEETLEQGSDVIVLGCTHYHWIEQEIKEIAGANVRVLQPEPIVISRLKTSLRQLA